MLLNNGVVLDRFISHKPYSLHPELTEPKTHFTRIKKNV